MERPEPPQPPAAPEMAARPTPPAAPSMGDMPAAEPAEEPAPGNYASSETMQAYREAMRARFDEYMQERQAQHVENVRRQREQREALMDQQRNRPGVGNPYAPPVPYPPAPGYGPRYPSAFPGYRTPYWQQ